jgi:hypothetical protein
MHAIHSKRILIKMQNVLVMCQVNHPVVNGLLIQKAASILGTDPQNISLSYLSELNNQSARNEHGEYFPVDFSMTFCDNDETRSFVQYHLSWYSLVMLNTSPAPYSPNLFNSNVLQYLTQILTPDGFLAFTYLHTCGQETAKGLSQASYLIGLRWNADIKYDYFQKIDENNNLLWRSVVCAASSQN